MSDRPVKVAIVGGGCASLTTAWELSKPEHAGKFEITVYQMGFRCGGKGASGRAVGDRIEEHGLHIWLGFYENAFALMRAVYEEIKRDPEVCRISHWWQAFTPDPNVSVADMCPDGHWGKWLACFPAGDGMPGDGLHERRPFTISGYLKRAAALVVELLRSVQRRVEVPVSSARSGAVPSWLEAQASSEALERAAQRFLQLGKIVGLTALVEAASLLRVLIERLGSVAPATILNLLDWLHAGAKSLRARLVRDDEDARRVWYVVDIVLACVRGAVSHRLAFDPRGFDAINDYDWMQWLRMHGASEASLESGFMRAIYDLTFAFEGGDPARPALAAGVAMRGATRMFFTYRGSLFWKMTSGMGDIVFAPLYEVLVRRGVKFEFFHQLEHVGLGNDSQGPHVATLDFSVQANVRAGRPYRPLIDVRGLPCWPASPDYEQLVDGQQFAKEGRTFEEFPHLAGVATKRLVAGADFDFAVLGLGLASVPAVCKELLENDRKWQAMMRTCKTTGTQAAQIWMKESMHELGWPGAPTNLSGYTRPFATWADMRQLIAEESIEPAPRSIAYFCCVLKDRPESPDFAELAYKEVRQNTADYLNLRVGTLWPSAVKNGEFRWELLCDARDGSAHQFAGEARLDSQYFTANLRGSARYSLSVPGSIEHRISPLDRSYDNFAVTGDWTASGLDSGCVESAVMSGLLAAHAISGKPALEEIIGYDHP